MEEAQKYQTGKGGTLFGPQIALIGNVDNDPPEYIIPPSQSERMLLRADGIKHLLAHNPSATEPILSRSELLEILKRYGKG
jgi:hypothetical protein